MKERILHIFRKIFKKKEVPFIYKRKGNEKVLFGVVAAIFIVYSIVLLYPLLFLIMNSFKDAAEYAIDMALKKSYELPDKAMWRNYIEAFQKIKYKDYTLLTMFWNSTWQIGLGLIITLPLNCGIGYIMAKYNNKFVDFVFAVVVTSMVINLGGSTSAFLKLIQKLGLYDKWQFILFTSFGFGNWLYFRSLYVNVASDYMEAAFLDGAGHFRVFFSIMMPMGKNLMGIFGVLGFIASWSDYMGPLMYTPSYPTVASGMHLVGNTLNRTGDRPMYFAAQVLSMIPVVTLFLLFSEKIMTGLSFGGLKG